MDAQAQEHFFEIKLTQEGSERILRLYRMVKWIFGLCIFLSVFFLGVSYVRLLFYLKLYDTGGPVVRIETVVLPVYTLVYSVLLICQIYSYFHFTRLCKRSIQMQNAELFNYSFKWLIRSALFSMIMLVVEFAMALFSLYVLIYLLNTIPAT